MKTIETSESYSADNFEPKFIEAIFSKQLMQLPMRRRSK